MSVTELSGGKRKCLPVRGGNKVAHPSPLPIHSATSPEVLKLLEIARLNPFWEFQASEVGVMMNLPANTLKMLLRSKNSPFEGGRGRPERVTEFFRSNPGWKPSQER